MIERYANRKKFLNKKSYINRRLNHDVIENKTAYIPCKVSGIQDIISKYSVKECESLDAEFIAFITDFIEYVPPEYPVVLEIIGPKFSPEEKRIITDTVTGELDYMLGKTEKFILHKRRMFFGMILGTIVSGFLLGIVKLYASDVPIEFFYVLFWLFADAFVRYIFIDNIDYKEEKIRVGRLASMKVEFKEDE
ncbi:MAG: hypothetical protein K6F00_01570 [Lachnospiraceae bacterium]|nr:hypothetical protein [Lachnospiraceae bacterium]